MDTTINQFTLTEVIQNRFFGRETRVSMDTNEDNRNHNNLNKQEMDSVRTISITTETTKHKYKNIKKKFIYKKKIK